MYKAPFWLQKVLARFKAAKKHTIDFQKLRELGLQDAVF
jgi:hypothetical protein